MLSKLMRVGLIVIAITLFLGNLALCVEATKDSQLCHKSTPDECNGKCVNLQSDMQNCGDCGNVCNPDEVCSNGKCVSGNNNNRATCTDGKKNGRETDIDCGGPTCPPCADSKTCKKGTDCSSRVCSVGHCRGPSCDDGVMNGGETGVDCGGPCSPCLEKVIGNISTPPGRKPSPVSGIGNISAGPAQNAPGTPAPTYKFVLDYCSVVYTRSTFGDTDYASFGVSVRNQMVNGTPKTKFLFSLENSNTVNSYPINIEIGPTPIPDDPNFPVIIAFLIVNSGEPHSNVDDVMNAGTEALINSYSGFGSSFAFADSHVKDILASLSCDGTVAADKIVTNGQEIAQWTATGSHTVYKQYSGTDSPVGCGSNSRYDVSWHVERVS